MTVGKRGVLEVGDRFFSAMCFVFFLPLYVCIVSIWVVHYTLCAIPAALSVIHSKSCEVGLGCVFKKASSGAHKLYEVFKPLLDWLYEVFETPLDWIWWYLKDVLWEILKALPALFGDIFLWTKWLCRLPW